MILTLSICGLVLVLIAVIVIQYYMSKEAFVTHRNKNNRAPNSSNACANVSDNTPIAEIPLECAQQSWLDMGCTKDGSEYPANRNVKMYTDPDNKTEIYGSLKQRRKIGKNLIEKRDPELFNDPEFMQMCFGTSPSDPSDACSGIPDSTPTEQVPIDCVQSQWMKLGCKKDAIGYPINSDNVISLGMKGLDFGIMKKTVEQMKQDGEFSKDENLRLLCHASENEIASRNQSAAPPLRNDIQSQVSISDTGYAAMQGKQKSDLLGSIQKIVRNELLANRATQPTLSKKKDDDCEDELDHNASNDSHCTAQGDEFKKATPKRMSKGCPESSDPCDSSDQPKNSVPKPYKTSSPDMSKYIKKDSIPCWGCSLDY